MIKLNVMNEPVDSLITDIRVHTKITLQRLFTCSLLSFTVSILFKSSSATTAQGTLPNKCKFKYNNSSFDDRFFLLCLHLERVKYCFHCTNRVEFLLYHFFF